MSRTLAPATDDALVRRVQEHDAEAFGELYDRFAARAYAVARAISRDGPEAEQVVQEAFLSVWRGRARPRPEHGTVAAWVMGIVREHAVDGDRDEALRRTLDRLPAEQRDVIALAWFGGLSTEEIAAELALPSGTVKGRIRLGLSELGGEPPA